MKVAALSKDLDFYRNQVELRDKTIESQREELFELKHKFYSVDDENSKLDCLWKLNKDAATHYRCERAEAITALVEISNTQDFAAKTVAQKALKNFHIFIQD